MRNSQIHHMLSVMLRLMLVIGMVSFSPGSAAKADKPLNSQFSAQRNMSNGVGIKDLPPASARKVDSSQIPPTDDGYSYQWYLREASAWGIKTEGAWNITTGSPNIVVAVIDTGITNHIEFNGRIVPGYDFISDAEMSNDGGGRDNDPSDPGDATSLWQCGFLDGGHPSSWHGTHVAGIIGANANNFWGGVGITWNSKILPLRVSGICRKFGSRYMTFTINDLIDGMRWAAGLHVDQVSDNNNPAKVINLSLEDKTRADCDPSLQEAINEIVTKKGAVIVAAAGNEAKTILQDQNVYNFQPANCNNVITVAATNRIGDRAFYSAYGGRVDISAPGGETEWVREDGILSTVDLGTEGPIHDGYSYDQGTSQAAAMVSGVISLMLSINPSLTPAQVLDILQRTATPFRNGGNCNQAICGRGILNAGAAVKYVKDLLATGSVSGYKLPWSSTSPAFYVWGDGTTHAMVQNVPRYSYDFGTYYGTALVAMKTGTVVTTGLNVSGGGHLIVIDTYDGYCSVYLHLSEILVGQGAAVTQGAIIGKSGKSSNGAVHTHITVYTKSGSSCTGYGNDYTKTHEVPIFFDEIGREPKRGEFLKSQNSSNQPPSISFASANGDTFPNSIIYSRNPNWTFTGTASDPEGQLNRVEWRCSGDGCGSQAAHSGAGVWLHTQNGMSGRNDAYFVAYDGYGNHTDSRHLDLRIDLAAPTTTPSLNGQSDATQWPVWFTALVNVNLHGADNSSGRALVGMGKVHYRLDGASWRVVSASDAAFTVSSDGSHTVDYYSEDALGNTEATRSFSFQIDQTPPALPTNLRETHGLISNVWQKTQNIPAFTWDAASDATSGLRGYQFYFGEDPNGRDYKNITASEPRQWTPFPAGVHTGTWYLRVHTQDNAGNWSNWATLFTFRYDGTPPENPADVVHVAGISTDWQNTTNLANFSWSGAHDEGSGIQGYYVYWGSQADGTSSTFITADAYQNPTPLCATDAACTGYLRLRSKDNVSNLAEDWNTVFILRYDNVPPQVDFVFNGGATTTTQSQVTLNVTSSDQGSGVYAARFSADGQTWTDWEQPADERLWNIQPISRQWWPVFAQVQDHVGLLSPVTQHEIYLDVNPGQTSSLNYRLFDQGLSGGSGPYASANYTGRGTLGPVADAPLASSPHYILSNGYEAGSQAIPLIVPGHDEFTFLDGIFASGVIASPLQSASYRMILSVGGIGLPPTTTISSASYRHQPGFLAAVQPQTIEPIVVEQPEMPAPDPEPVLACDAPSVSINAGAVYTYSPSVSLSLCAPFAVEMMLSNREDFAGAAWEPFAATRAWVIPTAGSNVDPHFVYAQFREVDGKVHATYFDDILYDPNRPSGALLLNDDIAQSGALQMNSAYARASGLATLQAAPNDSVTLYVDGSDDNSGISEMQLSADPTFTGADWQPFSPVASYAPGGEDGVKTVYARFQDEAGNLSSITAINFIYDTQPPVGYIFADPAVLPGDAVTTTLYLGDYSALVEGDGETLPTDPGFDGGAVEMRLGSDPALTDACWQPLADSVIVAVDPAQPEGTFYAQYRDAAGNVSEITSATYQVDTSAPDLSAVAEPGAGASRTVNIYASDNLSGIANLYLSNDPLMQQDVTTLPYTETLTWTFDERKVVWIVAEDGVGNRAAPYPVYATELIITISGNAGAAGATLSYTDGTSKTVTADDSGNYSFIVPYNWSGEITASKTGFSFSPVSRTYINVIVDQTAQDYIATTTSTYHIYLPLVVR